MGWKTTKDFTCAIEAKNERSVFVCRWDTFSVVDLRKVWRGGSWIERVLVIWSNRCGDICISTSWGTGKGSRHLGWEGKGSLFYAVGRCYVFHFLMYTLSRSISSLTHGVQKSPSQFIIYRIVWCIIVFSFGPVHNCLKRNPHGLRDSQRLQVFLRRKQLWWSLWSGIAWTTSAEI